MFFSQLCHTVALWPWRMRLIPLCFQVPPEPQGSSAGRGCQGFVWKRCAACWVPLVGHAQCLCRWHTVKWMEAGHPNKMFCIIKVSDRIPSDTLLGVVWRQVRRNEGIPVTAGSAPLKAKGNSLKALHRAEEPACTGCTSLGLFRGSISSPQHRSDLLPQHSSPGRSCWPGPRLPRGPANPCSAAEVVAGQACYLTARGCDLQPEAESQPCSVRNTTSSRKEWPEPGYWQWGITPPTDLDGIQRKPPSSRNKSAVLRISVKSTSGRYRPSSLLAYPCSKAPPHCAIESWPAFPGVQICALPNKLLNPSPLHIFPYCFYFSFLNCRSPSSQNLLLKETVLEILRQLGTAVRNVGSKISILFMDKHIWPRGGQACQKCRCGHAIR